ncbi:hypothetical protein GEMRC1_010668 [Eukaryota sp. GEM-RC1]
MSASTSQPVHLKQTPLCASVNATTNQTAFAYADGFVSLYRRDGDSFAPSFSIDTKSTAICLCLTPDAILQGTCNGISLIPFGGEISEVETDSPVTSLTHHRRYVFFGTCDGHIGAFAREKPSDISYLKLLFGSVSDITFNDSHVYAIGSNGHCYSVLFEDDELALSHEFKPDTRGIPSGIAVNNTYLVSLYTNGSAQLWDLESKAIVDTTHTLKDAKVSISDSSEILFVSCTDSEVFLVGEGRLEKQHQ